MTVLDQILSLCRKRCNPAFTTGVHSLAHEILQLAGERLPVVQRRVVGLSGPPGSGKDEAAKALLAHGWYRIAFADPLRLGLLQLNPLVPLGNHYVRLGWLVIQHGWDEAKKIPEVRELLQRYGTEAGREIHGSDCWVSIARKKVDSLPEGTNVVFTDVRFPEEVELIHLLGGKMAYIERPGVGAVNGHRSEQSYAAIRAQSTVLYNDSDVAAIQGKLLEFAGVA